MPSSVTDPLVSCEWLNGHLSAPDLAVLDATFFLPNQGRVGRDEYRTEHLPGAQFFGIDAIADHGNPLPHMLPTPEFFAESVGRLGIGNTSHVVVYDNNAFMASARVWWTFRVFGHDRVSVLDGGLRRWRDLHLPLTSGTGRTATRRAFSVGFRPELMRNLEQMRELVGFPGAAIVDARSPGRFAGIDPEPRPGVRPGHIPGSGNVCYKTLVDESTGLMKAPSAIQAEFEEAGIDINAPICTTCGTGVTAAILALGLFRLGRPDVPVYDGSWTEWGGRSDTPAEVGAGP